MKNFRKILTMLLIGLTIGEALAGEKTGNGGVVFLCPERVKLVDYWESEDLQNPMTVGNTDDSIENLVDAYLERIEFFDEDRAAGAKIFVRDVVKDLNALKLNPKAETKYVRYTNGPLNFSLDSDEVNAPPSCEKAQAITQKEPQIEGEKLLTIYRPIWDLMDNEMLVFTLFHEFHIQSLIELKRKQALAQKKELVPLTSTRPARLLNQYLGSRRFFQTKTICEYRQAISKFGILDWSLNNYGGFQLVHIDPENFKCDPVTRRPVHALNANKSIRLGNHSHHYLGLSSPFFDPETSKWISATTSGMSLEEGHYQYYVDESFFDSSSSSRNQVVTNTGKARPMEDGSVFVEGLERRRDHSGVGMIFRSGTDRLIGRASLRIFPDGKYEFIVHE
ncbi:MAG: hypothetical protein QE271_00285 [Bacteriovoracaceae bacterium]|nr:hypothetical protein [Bacteriovoracaceae bacterium]